MPAGRAGRAGDSKATRVRAKKASGLTCRNCRTRKIRCDGSQPACGICLAYNEECHYDKAPPMSQVLAMTDRIAELERMVRELQQNANQPGATSSSSTTFNNTSETYLESGSFQDTASSLPPETTPIPDDTTLDRSDAYYETTSAVHAPETALQQLTPNTATHSVLGGRTDRQHRRLLAPDARQLAFWADRVAEIGSVQLHLPPETVRHLLETHWTWVHPAFMFVNRETFLRDAATGGEFYSTLLLAVLCLHSTRFTDHHLSEELLARSKLLLGQEIHKEGSIPLVQALLQYSAHEIGKGHVSQAWLYSGMAFRIATDLDLFSETWNDQDEIRVEEARRAQVSCQLAWSCFLWDKIISLYFGRSPTLSEPPKSQLNPDLPVDEVDIWPKVGAGLDGRGYPETPSHKHACFANFGKLAVIINDVLLHIYGRRRTKQILAFVRDTRQRLSAWRAQSPAALRVDTTTEPQRCVPPHIVTQK